MRSGHATRGPTAWFAGAILLATTAAAQSSGSGRYSPSGSDPSGSSPDARYGGERYGESRYGQPYGGPDYYQRGGDYDRSRFDSSGRYTGMSGDRAQRSDRGWDRYDDTGRYDRYGDRGGDSWSDFERQGSYRYGEDRYGGRSYRGELYGWDEAGQRRSENRAAGRRYDDAYGPARGHEGYTSWRYQPGRGWERESPGDRDRELWSDRYGGRSSRYYGPERDTWGRDRWDRDYDRSYRGGVYWDDDQSSRYPRTYRGGRDEGHSRYDTQRWRDWDDERYEDRYRPRYDSRDRERWDRSDEEERSGRND